MPTPSQLPSGDLAALGARLAGLMLRDQHRLQRRIDGLRHRPIRPHHLDEISKEIDRATERRLLREASVPRITYPEDLPVSQRKDDIAAAIRDHQVVIVAGETGSGKTTQIPKICLELGRGITGMIGHTQPRRIAARTVADRIAEELGTELGTTIGFKVRFTDQASDGTLVKVMTDGILLAEIGGDRMLNQYDTIIIDEAHERSLNIDFILGCLKQLLPRRPDLKLIITSATIDPQRFSRHFDDAPIIEVSGRTYPVEVRYRPLLTDIETEDGDETEVRDQTQAICDAVTELHREGPGDVLVFLSGEREIRDTADALAGMNLRDTEILPLYARLSIAEQHRVFASHAGRRIVLATNVAETSLTVPGIKYVIDPGTARISRYSHRLKVQRLPIEPVSQASANQRKGRCGRTSDGICIRLYSEDDFASRPEFTDPEILRTNLAGVILQMTAFGLGDIAQFPFIDPPDRRNIADGLALLHELGAFAEPRHPAPAKQLTSLGRKLAALPVDPRMARMVVEADRNGCIREVMVIAAALSIVDPRERPTDKQQAAAEKHGRFADKDSDFLAFWNLWNYLAEQQQALSSSQFRKLCRADFLNYLRVREWQDIYGQLRQVVKQLGMPVNAGSTPADPARIHQSLLAGLLSHVGLKDVDKKARFEYIGARSARFSIAPGSTLFRSQPQWVVAAELVETSRLWARVVARVEPGWVEALAGHLVKRSYSGPHWSKRQAAVIAYEKVLLYGIPLVAARTVNYGRIDPVVSRELFIRHALVEGDWDTRHAFFVENRALLDEVEDLEHRVRRRDILADDETLYAFYHERIPSDVVSGRHFDSWWKRTRVEQPDLLSFDKSMLINDGMRGFSGADYPDSLTVPLTGGGEANLALSYQFEPGADADGVTVHVPLPLLGQLTGDVFDWQIPGLRADLVTALIKSLPKALRRGLVPAPDTAKSVLERVEPGTEPILGALERELRRMTGVVIGRADWDLTRVPDHLRMTFRITGETEAGAAGAGGTGTSGGEAGATKAAEALPGGTKRGGGAGGQGEVLAEDKDLAVLKQRLAVQTRAVVTAIADGIESDGITSWTIGTLPRVIERTRGGYAVRAYPALVDERDSVAVRVFDSEAAAERAAVAGTRRLLLLTTSSPIASISGRLTNEAKLTLMRNPGGNVGELLADCLDATVDSLIEDFGGPAWDAAGFDALAAHVRAELADTAFEVISRVRAVLSASHAVEARLGSISNLALMSTLTDVRRQLSGLVYPGFVTATGARRLTDLVRYLRAIDKRLEKLPQDPARDRAALNKIEQVEREYADWLLELPPGAADWERVRTVRWMIEELRVNYFAQVIGVPYPISDKRIYRAMDDVTDAVG